jgi:hypothetical protein
MLGFLRCFRGFSRRIGLRRGVLPGVIVECHRERPAIGRACGLSGIFGVPLGVMCRGGPVFCRGFPGDSGSLYKKNVLSLAAAREDDISLLQESTVVFIALFGT